MGFLIDGQDDGIGWRVQIEGHDLGRFGRELRVRTDAPTAASLKLDALFAEDAPDLVCGDVGEWTGRSWDKSRDD